RIVAAVRLDNRLSSGAPIESILDQAVDHRRISQGRSIAQVVQLVTGDLAQYAAHDLARAGLRQTGGRLDEVRPGEGADLGGDDGLELGHQLLGDGNPLHRDDVGIDRLALDIVRAADHRRLGDVVVEHQGALYLGG